MKMLLGLGVLIFFIMFLYCIQIHKVNRQYITCMHGKLSDPNRPIVKELSDVWGLPPQEAARCADQELGADTDTVIPILVYQCPLGDQAAVTY